MTDIIRLLPDAIANQIAAGEVVQRPASVVKELLENSVDAGARKISLILKSAGKQLIQVIDNGIGMSGTDARMSFERHATSKISTSEDLFAIRTLGFRGEALASIAAVAQVNLKTRLHDEEVGSEIDIEGSKVLRQVPCETPGGTNFSVKNLFFNVPARRKFLKSDTVELRHILDEFQWIALAQPDIHFEVYHNEKEVYHLPPGSLRKRIVGIFGKNINDRLVPIEEVTDLCEIHGFIGKPEAAKRRRGEQYVLVNNRFIKSNYLNHAVASAYQNILPDGSYPFFVLFLTLESDRIDVNVHPTKQEIKFEDERIIYNFVKATVKHALNQFNITPSLDFEQDQVLSGQFNPAQAGGGSSNEKVLIPSRFEGGSRQDWEQLYAGLKNQPEYEQPTQLDAELGTDNAATTPYQIHQRFILSQIRSGFILIDQQRAHERILYEANLKNLQERSGASQKLLFPESIDLEAKRFTVLTNHLADFKALGFDLEHFGQNTYLLHGVPAHLAHAKDPGTMLSDLLEQFDSNIDLELQEEHRLAYLLARRSARQAGVLMKVEEMRELIDQLFACENPFYGPTGKKCILTFELGDLIEKMN